MPTYDYRCGACAHEFELFQSMKDSPKRKCPACGKNALERLIGTGAGVLFKGSGFYETDYRSANYKKAAEAEKPKSGDAGSKDGAGTKKNGKPTKESSKDSSKPLAQTPGKPCGPSCGCAG